MEAGALISELKRRRVIRALVGYGIAAFAVLQIIEPVMHGLHWPEEVLSYVVVALAVGFPIVVSLAWIFDVNAGRVERTGPATTKGLSGVRLAIFLAGIGLLCAAPGLVWYFLLRSRPAEHPATATGPPSIAVLPFVNMSSDKETDYFSDGVTEELINALAHVDGLNVASRTAVFALKGKSLGVQQIGQELKVSTLLEGSIRREGNALRVTAQLIKVSDGYHLWSNTYDRELKSIFAVEDEIARSIAQSLRRTLVGVKEATADSAAHDLYLRGRFYWNKRNGGAMRKAAEYFEEAIGRDPKYALAWVGLADALALRFEYDNAPAAEVLPKARNAALRALEIDPAMGEAHASLGLVAYESYDWAAANGELLKAVELSPGYALAWKWLGNTQMLTGHLAEARETIQHALRLDPTSLIINNNFGEALYYSRDFRAAVEQFRKTLDMDPGFELARLNLVLALSQQGDQDVALAETETMHDFPEPARLMLRTALLARAHRRREAVALAQQIEARFSTDEQDSGGFAVALIALGEFEKSIALLRHGCSRAAPAVGLKVDPYFDPLRSDPRFRELLHCANLE